MIVDGTWLASELDYYQRELDALESAYDDKSAPEYLERRASLLQCVKMLEELGEPVEEDCA